MNQRTRSRAPCRILGVVVALCPVWASAQQVYRITDIGTLDGATEMYGTDINESGQVTGMAIVNGVERAFLWDGNTLIDLGTLGGSGSVGEAINSTGQVTGWSRTAEDLETHAFLWDGNSMQDLGTLGGTNSYPVDINDSGQVAGTSDITLDRAQHAFLWDGANLLDLGTLGGSSSEGLAINAAGQVAGYAQNAAGADRAFRWSGGVMRNLGTLGGTSSRGDAINASGQVAGSSQLAGNSAEHAFFWNGGVMQDLGTIEGDSFALGMNDTGQVIGNSYPVPIVAVHAFVWSGNGLVDLGNLGGTRAGADDINNSGHVVGGSRLADDDTVHPFLWIEGVMYDLNDLIDPEDPLKSYVTLTGGADINERGQIRAGGVDSRASGGRVYVLSPVAADVYLDLAALTDVNGNGAADAAVLAGGKVYVKDGATGELISEKTILDTRWRAIDLAVTPGGAGASIGVLAQKDDGSIAVAVYRARDGRLLLEIPFFGPSWLPSALAYVPNADGPGGSAFGVVAKNLDDQRVSVQLRRRTDGSLINTNRFYVSNWEAIAFDTMGDVSGNDRPELVVLARSELGVNQVLVKDADTAAIVNKINYLGANSTPSAIAVLGEHR